MKTKRIHYCSTRRDRRGVAIIMVIAFYAITVSIIGVWVRSALNRQQQVKRWHEKTQAVWLADAGVRRAMAQITRDAGYDGEVWAIAAAELGGPDAAEVVIRLTPIEAPVPPSNEAVSSTNEFEIVAVATYPAGTKKRVQHTQTMRFRIPAPTIESGESS